LESDVRALLQVVEVLKGRFRIRWIILVCDKGMVSEHNLGNLKEEGMDFIVGVRLWFDFAPFDLARGQ
jgi:transposase